MRKMFTMLTLALAMVLGAAADRAGARSALTNGVVTKVDPSASKITIRHGPMKKEDPMTMVYRAQDSSMLTAVKAGDKVKFDAENINGQFVVTKIQKAK